MTQDPPQRAPAHYPFPQAGAAAEKLQNTPLPEDLVQSAQNLYVIKDDTFGEFLTNIRESVRSETEDEVSPTVTVKVLVPKGG